MEGRNTITPTTYTEKSTTPQKGNTQTTTHLHDTQNPHAKKTERNNPHFKTHHLQMRDVMADASRCVYQYRRPSPGDIRSKISLRAPASTWKFQQLLDSDKKTVKGAQMTYLYHNKTTEKMPHQQPNNSA